MKNKKELEEKRKKEFDKIEKEFKNKLKKLKERDPFTYKNF